MAINLKNKTLLKTGALINGEWVDGNNHYNVFNPSTGDMIAQVSCCGKQETVIAVSAASKALKLWKRKTAKERAQLLRNWFNLIVENQRDLAVILTEEQGKPLSEAMDEITYGASYVEWFAEEAKRIYGDIIPGPSNDKKVVVIKDPIGVVACITPWNFPNAMLTRKIAPALAAGCTVICKPANNTPLSANALGELAIQAGIPAGVINIVSGYTREIGAELTRNPIIKKLTFTGSTPVGKKLMRECAQTVKRTSMELGGNAPFIVFDDADLDAAVQGAMISKFKNAGQTCVCSNRILVHNTVHDRFVKKLIQATQQLKIGDGMAAGTQIGPVIDEGAAQNILALIEDAVAKGGVVMTGGKNAVNGPCFIQPTVLTQVDKTMRIFNEEIFGPVAPVFIFHTEEEAIDIANSTEFGLASYFYTRDIGRVWRVSEALACGVVGVNVGAISNEMAPFGGVKESGNGREGSKYGLDDYLEIKYLCMGGLDK
ncbi:NAD-dependent succinate-semialdehyde dehydrogenase [Porticoccaceae bacterium]|nr:NAD-dependent succinate-semialdehyde dehydrogenase [Porticoccaceae bacterium]